MVLGDESGSSPILDTQARQTGVPPADCFADDAAGDEITALLQKWTKGDRGSLDQIFQSVYEQLRQSASHCMNGEQPQHTLQTTALIHEAYLRLCKSDNLRFVSRQQFFSFAAETMRRILVDHARARNRAKRGNAHRPLPLDERIARNLSSSFDPSRMLLLDQALNKLKSIDTRRYKIAIWWFFGGMNANEIGVMLDVSATTVRRELRAVRCWLAFEVRKTECGTPNFQ